MHHSLYPQTALTAVLRGRIVASFGRSKSVRFYVLQDFTEKIQILIDRQLAAAPVFDSFAKVAQGDAIEVEGTVGASNSGKLSVFPTKPVGVIPPMTTHNLIADDTSNVAGQLLLARLENRLRAFFDSNQFSEIAARHLSSAWETGGLQPLEVQFPGQSRVPFYLAVSPIPQLLRAVLTTAQPRLFMVSRSFATNFVATQNGAESIVAGAIAVGLRARDSAAMMVDAVQSLVGDYTTSVDEDLRAELEKTVLVSETTGLREPTTYPGLHIHITHGLELDSPGGFKATEAFRVCWRGEFDVAEGYSFRLGTEPCSAMLLSVERFLPLLRAGDNRRLENLETAANNREVR